MRENTEVWAKSKELNEANYRQWSPKWWKIPFSGFLTLKASKSGKSLPGSPEIWSSALPRAAPAAVRRSRALSCDLFGSRNEVQLHPSGRRESGNGDAENPPPCSLLTTGVHSHAPSCLWSCLPPHTPAAHRASFASAKGLKSALCRLAESQGVAYKHMSKSMMSDLRPVPSSRRSLLMNNSKSLQKARGPGSLQRCFLVSLPHHQQSGQRHLEDPKEPKAPSSHLTAREWLVLRVDLFASLGTCCRHSALLPNKHSHHCSTCSCWVTSLPREVFLVAAGTPVK